MRGGPASLDLRVLCPYCEYAATVVARDIRGQKFVLECLDCRETYVVEVEVQATHRTRALVDVDPDAVNERLARKNGGADPPGPSPSTAARARGATAAPAGNRSSIAKPGDKPPLKTRRMQGTRY